MDTKEQPVYSVVNIKNKLTCINTSHGATIGTLTYTGEIASGPIVTGDRCVVIFKTSSGLKGKIMRLPNFSTITTFNA
jgi:hypothetical protein